MSSLAQPAGANRTWQRRFARQRNLLIIWSLLLVLVVVASLLSDRFLRPVNITNIITQSTGLALVSIGQTFVLLIAGIDISVGSVISVVVSLLPLIVAPDPLSIALGVVVALLVGTAFGLVNGLLITRLRISPFMVTLAMLSVGQGLAYALRQTPPAVLPREYSAVFVGRIGPVPIPLLLVLVVTFAAAFVLRNTRFGRHVYAVGSNEDATRLSGLATDRVKLAVYGISGFFAGLAGAFIAARARAADPLIGQNFAFDAITAAVLGGASLFGGRGSVYGTIAGVLIVAILTNLLNLLGVSSDYQYVLKGLLLIFAVMLYYRH
jgi:ribose transport system permease protein